MKQDLFMDRQPRHVLISLWHDSVGIAVHELNERAPDGAVAHLSHPGVALPHCFYTMPYCDDNQLNGRQPSREANPRLRAIGVASAVQTLLSIDDSFSLDWNTARNKLRNQKIS